MALGDYLAGRDHGDRPDEYHEVGVVTQASPPLVAVGADSTGRPVSAVVNGVLPVVGDRVLVLVQGAARTVVGMLDPSPTWRTVQAAGQPTYENGWGNYGGGYVGGQFRRVGDMVQLRGLVAGGTVPATVFTLPVGYRPTAGALLWTVHTATGDGRLDVFVTGAVVMQGGSNTYVSINVEFSVA